MVDRCIPKRLVHKHTTDQWYDLILADVKVIETEFGKKPPRSAVIAYVPLEEMQMRMERESGREKRRGY